MRADARSAMCDCELSAQPLVRQVLEGEDPFTTLEDELLTNLLGAYPQHKLGMFVAKIRVQADRKRAGAAPAADAADAAPAAAPEPEPIPEELKATVEWPWHGVTDQELYTFLGKQIDRHGAGTTRAHSHAPRPGSSPPIAHRMDPHSRCREITMMSGYVPRRARRAHDDDAG
jgi:hypothetical protein